MSAALPHQQSFLDSCKYTRSLSTHTCRAYAQDLSDFAGFVGHHAVSDIFTTQTLDAYAHFMASARRLSPATIKRRMASLRTYFRWAVKAKLEVVERSEPEFPSIRLPEKLPRCLPRADIAALLSSNRAQFRLEESGAADRAVIQMTTSVVMLILISTGVRVGELVKIRMNDWSETSGAIRIRGKGGRDRIVYVTDKRIVAELVTYQRLRDQIPAETDFLFLNSRLRPLTEQTLRLRFHRLADVAQIGSRVTPHRFRHSAATMLLEQGMDIRFVQRLLGHRSIVTTQIYTHVSNASLRAALSQADHMEGFCLE